MARNSEGLAVNTIGIRFRTLRTIYNYALTNDWVKAENYPFKFADSWIRKYNVITLSEDLNNYPGNVDFWKNVILKGLLFWKIA